jgi:hypothetical protein
VHRVNPGWSPVGTMEMAAGPPTGHHVSRADASWLSVERSRAKQDAREEKGIGAAGCGDGKIGKKIKENEAGRHATVGLRAGKKRKENEKGRVCRLRIWPKRVFSSFKILSIFS